MNKYSVAGFIVVAFFTAMFVTAFVHHYPTNSGEWASWAQAIGTIAAIFGAVWIGNKQSELNRKDADLRQATAESKRLIEIIAIASHATSEMGRPKKLTEDSGAFDKRTISNRTSLPLKHAVEAMQGVPSHQLGSEESIRLYMKISFLLEEAVRNTDELAAEIDLRKNQTATVSDGFREEFIFKSYRLNMGITDTYARMTLGMLRRSVGVQE